MRLAKSTLLIVTLCSYHLAGAQGLPSRFKVTQYNVGSTFAVGRDLNDNGDMLTNKKMQDGSYRQAILRADGTSSFFLPVAGWNFSLVNKINDFGEAVGSGRPTTSNQNWRAIKWSAVGVPTALDLASNLSESFSPNDSGTTINNSGQIGGGWFNPVSIGAFHYSTTWDASTGSPTTYGPWGTITKITDAGHLFTEVANYFGPDGWHSYQRLTDEEFHYGMGASETRTLIKARYGFGRERYVIGDYLGNRLASFNIPFINADQGRVNDNGIVTLDTFNSETGVDGVSKIWSMATGVIDLTSLLEPGSGLTMTKVYDINNRNQMVGEAKDAAGNVKYVRLDPVPEPASMLAMGIGVVGLLKRKRSR